MKTLPFALATLLLLSCGGSHTDGLVLSLEARLAPQGPVTRDAVGWHFVRSDGSEVTLTRGLVAVRSVELVPCPASALRRALEALSPVATAHAHEEGSPRRLGAPHVLALGRDEETRVLGMLHPPPGRYCQAWLTLAPADAGGLGPDGDMVGQTLRLEGSVRLPGAAAPVPFQLASRGAQWVQVALQDVALEEARPLVAQRLVFAFDGWLEGWTPESLTAAQDALSNVAAAVRAEPAEAR